MAYNNNNHQNQYYNNYNNYNNGNLTSNDYYDNQEVPSNSRVQELNQKYLPKINTGNNNSTRSLGGATVVETPRVNPTENADDVDSIDSSLYSQHNRQAHQQFYGQPKHSVDEGESRPGSISTKRDSTIAQPQNAYDLGDMGDRHYRNYNQNGGYLSQYNNYHRYDEEATRHNTLTLGDPNAYDAYCFENDYTDRDFPGGGKGARQSMSGEQLVISEKKKRKGCCGCCSWPICLLITIIILTGLGVIGFFVIPRVPTVNVKDNPIPISQPILSVDPPSVKMDFNIIVAIGNEKNYVPYKFNKVEVTIFDRSANTANTNTPVATGTKLDYTLQPKSNDVLEFPLTVNYSAKDRTDPIIQNFVAACSPEVKNHIPLKLKVNVELSIWGIDWIYKPKISVDIPDMNCPIPNKFNKL